MTSIDAQRLIAWLRDRSQHTNPLVIAVYGGLADRIERGDFNPKDEQ